MKMEISRKAFVKRSIFPGHKKACNRRLFLNIYLNPRNRGSVLPVHTRQELFIVLGSFHAVLQLTHCFFGIHIRQVHTQQVHTLQHIFFEQQVVTTCG